MSIKELGGIFGRNPTFNDVTIEGQLTFDGDIDVGSDLKVDGDFEATGDSGFGIAPNSSYRVNVFDTSAVCMAVSRDGTDGDALQIFNGQNYGTRCLGLGVSGTHGTINNQYGNIEITTSSSLIGKFTVNGFAPENGKGIDFSATSGTGTSELFDDYEEGTWTPTIEGSTTAGTQTYNAQVAKYTKVGRTVTIYAYVSITSKDVAMAGNVRIGGLPYASDSTANALQALALGDFQGVTFGASKTQMLLRIPNNVNKINVYDGGSGLASAQISVSNINNATYFVVGGVYQTA